MARRPYRLTPRRRAALRKAQLASARKRRGTGKKVTRKRSVRRSSVRSVRRTPVRSTRKVRDLGSVSRPAARKIANRPSRSVRVKSHVVRNKKRYKAAGTVLGGAVAVAGTGAYAHHRYNNVYLYHNTDSRNIKSIKKTGLHGVKVGSVSHSRFREKPGMVFVAKDFNTTKAFGNHVVRVTMNRKEFNRLAMKDTHMPGHMRAWQIHESHLVGKKIRTRPGGINQRILYKSTFPGRTKESYIGFK